MLKTPPWLNGDYSSRAEATQEGCVASASMHQHWMLMWMFVSRDVIKTAMKTAGGSDLDALVVVHSLSHVQLFVTPWTTECQASLSFTVSLSLLH